MVDMLKELKTSATRQFVIESDINPRPNAHYQRYGCDRIHKQLITLLRFHGINSKNPLHTLRKEYASDICRQFVLYEASGALCHSSCGITESIYVNRKADTTPNFLTCFLWYLPLKPSKPSKLPLTWSSLSIQTRTRKHPRPWMKRMLWKFCYLKCPMHRG
jgi:hypothetical protein